MRGQFPTTSNFQHLLCIYRLWLCILNRSMPRIYTRTLIPCLLLFFVHPTCSKFQQHLVEQARGTGRLSIAWDRRDFLLKLSKCQQMLSLRGSCSLFGCHLTSRNPVAVINTMNASARSSTFSSSCWLPLTPWPIPALFFKT